MPTFDATASAHPGIASANISANASVSSDITYNPTRFRLMGAVAHTVYAVEIYGSDGGLKYTDGFHNLVTTAGLNALVDAAIKSGVSSPVWYVGLIDGGGVTPVYEPSDTAAAHAGWTEFTKYTEAHRVLFQPDTVSNGACDNYAHRAVFTINDNGSIAGCFMISENTISGTTGTLYGEGGFANGPLTVDSGDIVKIAVTVSMANG